MTISSPITTENVWKDLINGLFCVVGFLNGKGEPGTAGVVYTIENRKIYFSTHRTAWKTKHINRNPNVSLTLTIPKQIPFIPWIKIPPATATCKGTAQMLELADAPAKVQERLFKGMEDLKEHAVIFEVTPKGNFVTFGVAISLKDMRDMEKAVGNVPAF